MTHLMLLAATVPNTPAWSPKIAIIMIVCNILAIAIARNGIQKPNVGPSLPASDQFFGGMSLPALLAATSFGHILGTGAILGLAYIGAI